MAHNLCHSVRNNNSNRFKIKIRLIRHFKLQEIWRIDDKSPAGQKLKKKISKMNQTGCLFHLRFCLSTHGFALFNRNMRHYIWNLLSRCHGNACHADSRPLPHALQHMHTFTRTAVMRDPETGSLPGQCAHTHTQTDTYLPPCTGTFWAHKHQRNVQTYDSDCSSDWPAVQISCIFYFWEHLMKRFPYWKKKSSFWRAKLNRNMFDGGQKNQQHLFELLEQKKRHFTVVMSSLELLPPHPPMSATSAPPTPSWSFLSFTLWSALTFFFPCSCVDCYPYNGSHINLHSTDGHSLWRGNQTLSHITKRLSFIWNTIFSSQ